MNNLGIFATALAAISVSGGAATAHHSTAMFEWGGERPLSGTVREIQWTNPHTFIIMDVPNERGGQDTWTLEGMSPNNLVRFGWTRTTLKPGDHVDMIIYPLRDGRYGGFTVRVTLPDGRTIAQVGDRSTARGIVQ
jgi:hypothetical protein